MGSDIYRNRQQIAERLNLVREQLPRASCRKWGRFLPSWAKSADRPAADPAKVSPMQVREYADWVVAPRLLTIPGALPRSSPSAARCASTGLPHCQRSCRPWASNGGKIERRCAIWVPTPAAVFLNRRGREYLIRQMGRTSRVEDLRSLVVQGEKWAADFAAAGGRRWAGPGGQARRCQLQRANGGDFVGAKAASADSVALTQEVEAHEELKKAFRRSALRRPSSCFKQADFIENARCNVMGGAARRRHSGRSFVLFLPMCAPR